MLMRTVGARETRWDPTPASPPCSHADGWPCWSPRPSPPP